MVLEDLRGRERTFPTSLLKCLAAAPLRLPNPPSFGSHNVHISLEGLDRCGFAILCKELVNALREHGGVAVLQKAIEDIDLLCGLSGLVIIQGKAGFCYCRQ